MNIDVNSKKIKTSLTCHFLLKYSKYCDIICKYYINIRDTLLHTKPFSNVQDSDIHLENSNVIDNLNTAIVSKIRKGRTPQ